jgi:chloramphenicol 3-O-phosphotransferase
VTGVKVGSEDTRLIVLRGNSASGKSSVAAGLRERFGRGLAVVAQDNLRCTVARCALDAGFHVVVEGILAADRGPTRHYYLDVPFDEPLARHATKPIAD